MTRRLYFIGAFVVLLIGFLLLAYQPWSPSWAIRREASHCFGSILLRSVEIHPIKNDFPKPGPLSRHEFFVVSIPPRKDGCTVVYYAGQASALPYNFNKAIVQDNLRVSGPQTVLAVAGTYISVVSGQAIILNSKEDIPRFLDGVNRVDGANHGRSYNGVIAPPAITAVNGGYKIEATSWSKFFGSIVHWKLTMDTNGRILESHSVVLATLVGPYTF